MQVAALRKAIKSTNIMILLDCNPQILYNLGIVIHKYDKSRTANSYRKTTF